jgi:hypothetical protein
VPFHELEGQFLFRHVAARDFQGALGLPETPVQAPERISPAEKAHRTADTVARVQHVRFVGVVDQEEGEIALLRQPRQAGRRLIALAIRILRLRPRRPDFLQNVDNNQPRIIVLLHPGDESLFEPLANAWRFPQHQIQGGEVHGVRLRRLNLRLEAFLGTPFAIFERQIQDSPLPDR